MAPPRIPTGVILSFSRKKETTTVTTGSTYKKVPT
jgi:hypothetical protein